MGKQAYRYKSSNELIRHINNSGFNIIKSERWYIRSQFKRIKRTIEFIYNSNIPVENILDAGCGRGLLFLMLGRTGTGLDAPHIVETCRQRGIDAYPVNLEQEKFPLPDCSFDIVTCLEVIEHFTSPGLMLLEIRRVLKKGGFIVLSTPNSKSLHWRLADFLWKNPVWP